MKPFDVYPVFPIEIEKGIGCRTYDKNGVEYLDLYGGHAVISIGHSHPYFVQKLTHQAENLMFYSNSIVNKLQDEMAEKLGKMSGYDDYSLFLVNSGAEANENALKLASFHNGRKKVLALQKSFHGRTSAAVRVTDNPSIVAPVNAGLEVVFTPINDIEAIRPLLEQRDISSVVIEGIQGVGGIHIPEATFLKQVEALCKATETVLILDEIQSGYGRSGKFFAHQYADIRPGLITVAKGMGNGYPIGGVLIGPEFKASYGLLGTTFGGNHLACVAGSAVLDIIKVEKLVENAEKVGSFLMTELKKIPGIREVRGLGMMIGIEFDYPVKDIRNRLLFEEKVFTGASGTNIIRLLPPLSLTIADARIFLERFIKVLDVK